MPAALFTCMIEAIWKGRIVSETALTTRLNAARSAIGDTGEEQRPFYVSVDGIALLPGWDTSRGATIEYDLGKQLGVYLFAILAIRLRLADLPAGATQAQCYGVALLCGIGFTMSLFIGGLAFGGHLTGFTVGSVLLLGYMVLLSAAAFTLWSLLLRANRVSTVAAFNFLVPIFGAALSAIFLGEAILEWKNAVALVLVCWGIWLVTREPASEKT
mgnify:CR=1 FL=1